MMFPWRSWDVSVICPFNILKPTNWCMIVYGLCIWMIHRMIHQHEHVVLHHRFSKMVNIPGIVQVIRPSLVWKPMVVVITHVKNLPIFFDHDLVRLFWSRYTTLKLYSCKATPSPNPCKDPSKQSHRGWSFMLVRWFQTWPDFGKILSKHVLNK